MRDEGVYGCAVPRAQANRNPGLVMYLTYSTAIKYGTITHNGESIVRVGPHPHLYGSGLRRITALCLPCILLLGMCARTSPLLACYVGRSSMKTCSASVCMFVLSQIIIVVNIIISQQNLGKSHVMVPEGVDCVKSCRITDTDCISLPTVPSIIPEVSAPSFANTAASQTERAYISSGPLFMGWGGEIGRAHV